MIILILKIIFITVCLGWAAKISTEQDMVFQKFGAWADNEISKGNIIWEALFRCEYCVPSFWTLPAIGLGYLLGIVTTWEIFIAYPIIVGGSSMVLGLLFSMAKLIVSVTKYFKYLNGDN